MTRHLIPSERAGWPAEWTGEAKCWASIQQYPAKRTNWTALIILGLLAWCVLGLLALGIREVLL
jgi:hypothetical protein